MTDSQNFLSQVIVSRSVLALLASGLAVGSSLSLKAVATDVGSRASIMPSAELASPLGLQTPATDAAAEVIAADTINAETINTEIITTEYIAQDVEGWPSLLNPLPSPSEEESALDEAVDVPTEFLEADNIPPSIASMVRRIDRAASNENLDVVMGFYSDELDHSDGLDVKALKAMLKEFWDTYDNLNYSTQITDWAETDAGFTTTTVTTITGQADFSSQPLILEATLESQQVIRDRQIIEQTILAESSQIQLGQNPPSVDVNLPDVVGIGQTFFFDAVVMEPIGESLLMGTAFSDPVSLDTYRTVPALDVGVLGAGGLFKMGDASLSPGQEWVSGLIFREDGITGVSQRLRVVNLSDL